MQLEKFIFDQMHVHGYLTVWFINARIPYGGTLYIPLGGRGTRNRDANASILRNLFFGMHMHSAQCAVYPRIWMHGGPGMEYRMYFQNLFFEKRGAFVGACASRVYV
jgi:hypothetical protein